MIIIISYDDGDDDVVGLGLASVGMVTRERYAVMNH